MAAGADISILRLAREDDHAFESCHAICASVIERSEQKAEADLRATFVSPDYVFLAARRDDRVLGFASLFMPADEPFWLLEYLAVSHEAQGAGLGATLFASAVACAGDRTGLLEVDALPPDDDDRRGKAGRRLAFYGRLGCRRVAGVDYLLPLDTYGTPPPMLLLANAPAHVSSLRRDCMERWLRLIYSQVYAQSVDDPRITRMIAPLPDRVDLAVI